jgi:hypothetical protein
MLAMQLGIAAGWLAGAVLLVERLMHGGPAPLVLAGLVLAALYAWGTVALVMVYKRLGELESRAEGVGARSKRLEAALRACGIDPDGV